MIIQNDLKQLVSQAVKLLGKSILEIHGKKLYREIESLRVKMKTARGQEPAFVEKVLEEVYLDLKNNSDNDLHQKAKAFSLMLELINVCEAAYRSHRLENYLINGSKKPEGIIYVFTSHPTESRSQNFLKIMDSVEELLTEALKKDFSQVQERLMYLLKIAVRMSLANNRRPQVKDEMEQVFHTVLDPKILEEQIALNQKDVYVSFRTWVGGDKDGHPKVGPETMLESFTLSREKILGFISQHLVRFEKDLKLIPEGKIVYRWLTKFKRSLRELRKIHPDDGKKIVSLKKQLGKLKSISGKCLFSSPVISDLETLIWLYPALVLPLEIREDSEFIRAALRDKKQTIYKMLLTLKSISNGMDPKWYVRGFVISMCQETEDMLAAAEIVKKALGTLAIPIIPLFENEKGLTRSTAILEGAFKKFPFQKEHKAKWGNRFEVMVGYSDSSKENGVIPARLMIESGLYTLEKFLHQKKLKPVFFHGSGGSTSRGGGTVLEQTAWWPESALNIHKVTIQGEMVQRNFNNPLIMRSQVGKVVESFVNHKPKKEIDISEINQFANSIQESYRSLVKNPSFQELTIHATPYEYLNLLKIGSRPTKRSAKGTFSLRAIPWILCWTQTRLNLPVWWGVGAAWEKLSNKEREKTRRYYKKSLLMQSYIKNLGFTLAKVEMGVWNFHLEHCELASEDKKHWREVIACEFDLAVKFFHEISGVKNFTWFRPWLGESIYFRSSMIHPLNVIQKLALERKDNVLLRETVTGIACGMLTTG